MGLKPIYIYLDSCLVIYLVEEHPVFAPVIENRAADIPEFIFVVSHLTEMECLVMPLRKNNLLLITKFRNWFKQAQNASFNKATFQQAAQLRADFSSLKTSDAIHLATAEYHNCDEFWTNDNRLDKVAPHIVKNIL